MSQTGTNVRVQQILAAQGYEVLYADYANTSRGGSGVRGKIALIFEHALDRCPDVVAVTGDELLLVEIDSNAALVNILPAKCGEYRRVQGALLEAISQVVGRPLEMMRLAFAVTNFREPNLVAAKACFDTIITSK